MPQQEVGQQARCDNGVAAAKNVVRHALHHSAQPPWLRQSYDPKDSGKNPKTPTRERAQKLGDQPIERSNASVGVALTSLNRPCFYRPTEAASILSPPPELDTSASGHPSSPARGALATPAIAPLRTWTASPTAGRQSSADVVAKALFRSGPEDHSQETPVSTSSAGPSEPCCTRSSPIVIAPNPSQTLANRQDAARLRSSSADNDVAPQLPPPTLRHAAITEQMLAFTNCYAIDAGSNSATDEMKQRSLSALREAIQTQDDDFLIIHQLICLAAGEALVLPEELKQEPKFRRALCSLRVLLRGQECDIDDFDRHFARFPFLDTGSHALSALGRVTPLLLHLLETVAIYQRVCEIRRYPVIVAEMRIWGVESQILQSYLFTHLAQCACPSLTTSSPAQVKELFDSHSQRVVRMPDLKKQLADFAPRFWKLANIHAPDSALAWRSFEGIPYAMPFLISPRDHHADPGLHCPAGIPIIPSQATAVSPNLSPRMLPSVAQPHEIEVVADRNFLCTAADAKGLSKSAPVYRYVTSRVLGPVTLDRDTLCDSWAFEVSCSHRTAPGVTGTETVTPIATLGSDSAVMLQVIDDQGVHWSEALFLTCNNQAPLVLLPVSSENHSQIVDITHCVHHGWNVLQMNGLPIIRETSVRIIIDIVQSRTRERIVTELSSLALASHTAHRSIVEQLRATSQDKMTIRLRDPLRTSTMWKIPVRSAKCEHKEVFDLDIYLLNQHTCREGNAWQCPICSADARPCVMVLDNFLLHVRAELEKLNYGDCVAVDVLRDGSWRPVIKDMVIELD